MVKIFDQWSLVGSTLTGIAPDILKLLSLLLISIPLSIPIPYLIRYTTPRLVHTYSILISIWFLVGVFDLRFGLLQLLISSLTTYLISRYLIIHRSSTSQQQHHHHHHHTTTKLCWSVFAGLLVHLTINHARRIIYKISYDTVEITGAQMVLVMKLSTFVWNVYDGHHRPNHHLDSYQQSTAIREMPDLLEFLAYCFFFPSLLVGPAIPFMHYKSFIERPIDLPSGRFLAATRSVLIGLSFAGLVAVYGSRWSYETMLDETFLEKNWLQRLFHVQVSGLMARSKYYLVWSLSEAAFIISGCGYDPVRNDWSSGSNLQIFKIECAQNYKAVFDNWNMKTNIWLRECVYKRVSNLVEDSHHHPRNGVDPTNVIEKKREATSKKPGFKSTMATFAASAAWHGPLPAYFLVFLSGGIVQALGRSIRKSIRPFFLNSKPLAVIYNLICLIGTQTNLNYLVIPFVLLDVRKSFIAYSRVGYYGHLTASVLVILLWVMGGETYLSNKLNPRPKTATTTTIPTMVTAKARRDSPSPTHAKLDQPSRITTATTKVVITERSQITKRGTESMMMDIECEISKNG